MKVSDYIISYLENKGVDTMFYLPGGGCMHLLDSMASSRAIQSVSLLHEQAVAIACEAYSNTAGKMGVALATTGPGATNTVTGMLAAYLDSIPCLFLTGQVKTGDLKSRYGVRALGSQEADIVSIVSSITKYAVMVTEKESILYHLDRAWQEATTGRKGPVLLDIPLDVQGAQIEPFLLEGFIPLSSSLSKRKTLDIAPLLHKLSQARRPVCIAGNGIAGHRDLFHQLIEKLGIPVIPSWKAMDLLANGHPLYAGRAGGMGDRPGNLTVQNADFVLSLGCRLDFSIIGYDRTAWAPKADKFVVDIDPAEMQKLQDIPRLYPLLADTEEVMQALLNSIDNLPDWTAWLQNIALWKKKYPVVTREKYTTSAGALTTYGFVDTLSRLLPGDACIAPCSSGTTAEIFFQAFTVKTGQTVRSNHGLGAMGFELPDAIGMCIAAGYKDTICIAGDGGMQLNIQELAVIRGLNLPIKIFVINNGGYASIRNMQNNHFEGRHAGCDPASGLLLPELQSVANAYGLPYYKIDNADAIEQAVQVPLQKNGPVLCEVMVDPDCVVTPRSASQVLPDGSMRSSRLENQYPFLSDEEMRDNLLD